MDQVAQGYRGDGDSGGEVGLRIEQLEVNVGFKELLLRFPDEIFAGDAHDTEAAVADGNRVELKAVGGEW